MDREFSFEEETPEDDDFMRFYKKYRPMSPSVQGSGGLVRTSSVSTRTSSYASSPNFSEQRAVQRSKPPKLAKLKDKFQSWCRSAGGSTSVRSTSTVSRMPRSKSAVNSDEDVASLSMSSSTSPLQGLSGMLADKMTFSNSSQRSSLINGGNLTEETPSSRDSGHSSGGSPDLGGVRKRRGIAPPLPPKRPNGMMNGGGDWYRRHYYQPGNIYGDRDSVYSFQTARLDNRYPHDDTRSHYGFYDAVSSYPNNSLYQDQVEEEQTPLECWTPYPKRSFDAIKDNEPYFGVEGSPCRKRPCQSEYGSQAQLATSSSPAAPPAPPNKMSVILTRLWIISKAILLSTSFCLFIFLLNFTWRSYRCDSDRTKNLDMDLFQSRLSSQLFGQHLAEESIISALNDFVSSPHSVNVLVLIGWLGVGKTYTTSLLKESFPLTDNTHSFSVPLHFAKNSDNYLFLDDLSLLISRSCGHSLVLFDDLDAENKEEINQIEKFIYRLTNSRLASRSNGTLVVISSNLGGRAINHYVLEMMKQQGSHRRSSLTQSEIMRALDESGVDLTFMQRLKRQSEIKTTIVPYLPLTREQLRQCVRHEFHKQGRDAVDSDVDAIVEDVGFSSSDFPVISKTGCKRIATKVDYFLGGQDP